MRSFSYDKNKTIPLKENLVPVGDIIIKTTKKLFQSRGFLNIKIISEWENIVGEEFAKKYKPSKIIDNKNEIILFVDPSTLKDRQDIIYNNKAIVDKINQFLGHHAIDCIRISSIK